MLLKRNNLYISTGLSWVDGYSFVVIQQKESSKQLWDLLKSPTCLICPPSSSDCPHTPRGEWARCQHWWILEQATSTWLKGEQREWVGPWKADVAQLHRNTPRDEEQVLPVGTSACLICDLATWFSWDREGGRGWYFADGEWNILQYHLRYIQYICCT